jgi:hypothetical protein
VGLNLVNNMKGSCQASLQMVGCFTCVWNTVLMGKWGLSPPVKLESHHMTFTVSVSLKFQYYKQLMLSVLNHTLSFLLGYKYLWNTLYINFLMCFSRALTKCTLNILYILNFPVVFQTLLWGRHMMPEIVHNTDTVWMLLSVLVTATWELSMLPDVLPYLTVYYILLIENLVKLVAHWPRNSKIKYLS